MSKNHATWNMLMTYTLPRLEGIASQHFYRGMEILAYDPDKIPHLERVRDLLYKKTGWMLKRATGEVPAVEFLEMLSRKEFPLVFELRPPNQTFASANPDLWHELIGHVPVLFDSCVRELYWEIGKASKNASDDKMDALIRLYWYFAEYGLIEEDGEPKIFGAGLLASPLGANSVKNKRVKIRKMMASYLMKAELNPYSFQDNLFVFSSFERVFDVLGGFCGASF